MSPDLLALAPIYYVVFLFSTVCHEAAHALVARWGGDVTAYTGGQVSLDPIPHIRREPFGLVVVPILLLVATGGRSLFGWGSAPFNPLWQIRYPRRAALMALAGPVANFTLACIAFFLIRFSVYSEIFLGDTSGFGESLLTFLHTLFMLNVVLGVFNLLPLPPLDGWSVLGLVLPEDLSLKMIELARTPGASMVGILVAWQLFPRMAGPVLQFAQGLLLLGL